MELRRIGQRKEKSWGLDKRYSLFIWGAAFIIFGLIPFILNYGEDYSLLTHLSGYFTGPVFGSFVLILFGIILVIGGLIKAFR